MRYQTRESEYKKLLIKAEKLEKMPRLTENTLNFIHVKRGGKKFQIEQVTKVAGGG